MKKSDQDLFRLFEDLQIPHHTTEHEPTFTVEDSKRIKLGFVGASTKNLLLKVKKKPIFVLVPMIGDDNVELRPFAKSLGFSTFSFATKEQMWDLIGVEPGHVSPFALINFDPTTPMIHLDPRFHLEVIIDQDLLNHEYVNFHPLRNDKTTRILSRDLIRFLEALKIPFRSFALPKSSSAPLELE